MPFAIIRVIMENKNGDAWEIVQEEDAVTIVDTMASTQALETNAFGCPTKIAVTVFASDHMTDLREAATRRIIEDALARVI